VPREWLGAIGLLLVLPGALADENWREELSRMPLREEIRELNRTNCVELILAAFQSNSVVKALIFLPGATDEFYMYNRAQAQITNSSPSLLQALDALTSQTRIRATFRSPMLLLYTDEDRLEPKIVIQDELTANKIRKARSVPHLLCNDGTWDYLQPSLRWSLGMDIRPWRNSTDSWHFYRHSFAGWGLSGWEGMEAAALAGKTKFTVKRKSVVFELDAK
jgi:hypothetical protein